jgi:hypothetical protein
LAEAMENHLTQKAERNQLVSKISEKGKNLMEVHVKGTKSLVRLSFTYRKLTVADRSVHSLPPGARADVAQLGRRRVRQLVARRRANAGDTWD